jgi:hypothetical protein
MDVEPDRPLTDGGCGDVFGERVFNDRSRWTFCFWRNNVPVIVECKQHPPTTADIEQLRYVSRGRDWHDRSGRIPRLRRTGARTAECAQRQDIPQVRWRDTCLQRSCFPISVNGKRRTIPPFRATGVVLNCKHGRTEGSKQTTDAGAGSTPPIRVSWQWDGPGGVLP